MFVKRSRASSAGVESFGEKEKEKKKWFFVITVTTSSGENTKHLHETTSGGKYKTLT